MPPEAEERVYGDISMSPMREYIAQRKRRNSAKKRNASKRATRKYPKKQISPNAGARDRRFSFEPPIPIFAHFAAYYDAVPVAPHFRPPSL